MSKKYKHRTGMFGESAEFYVSSLFLLNRKPDGNQSPDLFDGRGIYHPHLLVEVKSGAKMKGVINDFQLHYAIQTFADYVAEFGVEPPLGLRQLDYSGRRVAVYYDVPDRVDGVAADELDRPFASVKLRFADQFIVPSKFAFHQFAVCKAMRTGESLDTVIKDLTATMKQDVIRREEDLHQNERKKNKNSWQNLQGRDVLAVFYNDLSLTSKPGRTRVEMMKDVYDTSSLRRIVIPGPRKSNIYVLANTEDYELFDKQLRGVVDFRTPVLEKVIDERKRAEHLLKKIIVSRSSIAFRRRFTRNCLSPTEVEKLGRLCRWESKEDVLGNI